MAVRMCEPQNRDNGASDLWTFNSYIYSCFLHVTQTHTHKHTVLNFGWNGILKVCINVKKIVVKIFQKHSDLIFDQGT